MEENSSLNNKRIAKNTLLLYIRMMIMMILSLYTSREVLRILGVEDFGIYNVVGGVVSMMAFLNGALNTATQRYLNFEMGKKNFVGMQKVFSISIICYIGIAIIAMVLAESLGLWFVLNKLVIPYDRLDAALWVYHFSVFSFVITLFAVPYNAAIIAHEKMSLYAYISIGAVFMKLLLVLVLQYVDNDKLFLYALMMLVTTILESLLYICICHKEFQECRLIWVFDKKIVKGLFSFSGWMFSGIFTHLLNIQGTNILINLFFGPIFNASRAIAVQVNSVISLFSTNFLTAVRPQIVKLYAEGNYNEMYSLVYNSSRYSFFLLFALIMPLGLNINLVLELWLDKVPEYTPLFTQLVLVDLLIISAYNPIAYISQAANKIKEYQLMISGCFIAAFSLTWIAYGLGLKVYITFVIAIIIDIIGLFLRLWITNRILSLPLRKYYEEVIKPILVVVVFTLIILLLPKLLFVSYNQMNPFVHLILNIIVTLTSIWLFGMRKPEKCFLIKKINTILHR